MADSQASYITLYNRFGMSRLTHLTASLTDRLTCSINFYVLRNPGSPVHFSLNEALGSVTQDTG